MDYLIISLGISALLALIPASVAKNKGYSYGLWWFYGWMLWIIAIIHIALLPDKNKNQGSNYTGPTNPTVPATANGKSGIGPHTPIAINSDASVTSLLDRAAIFLEDGNWLAAYDYCEAVLNQEPRNPQAYLGKLMAELRVSRQEDLANLAEPFDAYDNYQKAVRFADEDLASTLQGYISHINQRNADAHTEQQYNKAITAMGYAKRESDFLSAAEAFKALGNYQEASTYYAACLEKAEAARLESEQQAEAARVEAARKKKRNKKIAAIAAGIVCVVVAFVVLLNTVIIPNRNYNKAYNKAVGLMESGDYAGAVAVFVELGNFKDSSTKLGECAVELVGEEKWSTFRNLSVGSIFEFGSYEKESIEWQVLDIQDGKALVISRHILFDKPYNYTKEKVTWSTCSLREFLNGTFIWSAFSDTEKAMIPTVTVSADGYEAFDQGDSTQDQIFLLSHKEVEKYFRSNDERNCDNDIWWLRTSAGSHYAVLFGSIGNTVGIWNDPVSYLFGVRPAMWIYVG